MSRRKYCVVDTCREEVKYAEAGLCGACYAALYYWKDATPTELVRHKRKLARSDARMSMRLGNVTTTRRRKAK